ncbi:MAG: DNA polymerase III subunit beta [Alphaproteobacteria bacterium]|nr:DNA polymerase III subunit beta [Alphaproteobacteria bacterium]
MKFTIERALLLRSLAHVQNVVERRNTIPILSNVRVEAENATLALAATDMDLAVVDRVPADVAQAGATTAPAHTLYDIVRKLPEGAQVEFDHRGDTQRLTIRAGRSRFQLAVLPTEEFPAVGDDGLGAGFMLAAEHLRYLIDKTRFAISTEETRYYLNGIYLHAVGSGAGTRLRAVATDGHRLARAEVPAPDGVLPSMPGVIVPRKTVQELRKLVEDGEAMVNVALSPAKIRFGLESTVVTSKLIDGTFPDYERVIPTGNDKMLTVERAAFQEAVDRVSTISSDKGRAIKLVLERERVLLSATSPDSGTAEEEVPATFSGARLEIGFNSRYLLDITQQMAGDSVEMMIADGASPTLIRGAGDEGTLYVLMPMRV